MASESTIPQKLMTGALLHFESGVPITDLDIRSEHKDRMVRVDHVYWLWKKNPFLDTFQMFKQLIKGTYADRSSEHHAAQKDQMLFEYVRDHVSPPSRRDSEAKVRYAAEQAIRIGLETDNAMALTKGGKLLYEVAGLNQPESEQADMSRAAFLPTVVVTDIKEVDDTKENIDDEETKRIIAKYGGFVDEKHQNIEQQVALMEARRAPELPENTVAEME